MSRSKDVEKLSKKELEDLYKKLRFFGYKRYRWITERVSGVDMEEIVQDTVVDLYTGQRTADPNIPLFTVMCNIVRSKVSHIWAREKARMAVDANGEIEETPAETNGNSPSVNYLEYLAEKIMRESPHLLAPVKPSDQQAIYNELCATILNLVHDDPMLTRIVRVWIDNPDMKPRDMAKELRLTMKEFRNAQKRLRTRVQTLKEVKVHV